MIAAPELVALLESQPGLAAQTTRRLGEELVRFLAYLAQGWGLQRPREVEARHAREFVLAPLAEAEGLRPASVATAHLRRSALRLLFRSAREYGLAEHDPTLDLVLPPRSSLTARPLTDDEVALCRSFSLRTLTETRQPAAWALAEATARTAEIANVRLGDVDFAAGRVWIGGTTKTEARWGELTAWGGQQLERRLKELGAADLQTPLVYAGRAGAESAQASSCAAITETLTRAGLAQEPDVRPISVVAWAGAQVLEETGRIDEVARRLGVRSLDRAARLIAWDWPQG